MPRSARLYYPGGLFHVVTRCTGGKFSLRGDAERDEYLRLLGQSLGKTDTELLAYCLMSNHIHLVVIQGREPLERLLKPTHTGLAVWLNRRRRRPSAGPVFASRPRSLLVDSEEYLLELVRYVHNNPVRAGVVRRASASDWSSHRAYLARETVPEWLNVGYVLERFGRQPKRAGAAFDAFVRDGQREQRRGDLSGDADAAAIRAARRALGDGWRVSDPILGSAKFARKVMRDVAKAQKALATVELESRRARRRPAVRDLVAAVWGLLDLEPWEFEERPKARTNVLARQLIVWTWVRHFGGKQIDIARELQVDTSAVARWYGRAAQLAPEIEPLAEMLAREIDPAVGKRKTPPAGRVWHHVRTEE